MKSLNIISNQKLLINPQILRVFEVFVILVVITRIPFQIQPCIALVVTLSREYLHTIYIFLFSPTSVFILGNAIVITLFVNSPNYHAERSKSPSDDPRKKIAGEETIMRALFVPDIRVYRRSKSERRGTIEKEIESGGMRRAVSNIEISKTFKGYCGKKCATRVGHYPEDRMSREEFRKTVEDFIARQQRLLKQEDDFSVIED